MSQFSANPTEDHHKWALYIVCYLAIIRDLCLTYKRMSKDRFLAYSDTDWAGDLNTWRSTMGYCIFFVDGIVSWLSRHQRKVTLSSTEVEYVRMMEVAKQLTWIKSLFSELKINLPPFHLQWGAKPLQCLIPNQGTLCPVINHGNFTLLWCKQIKYKPLAITLSPGSCDFAYILQRYIHFKTSIPLQQFCTPCFPGYISTWYSLPLPW